MGAKISKHAAEEFRKLRVVCMRGDICNRDVLTYLLTYLLTELSPSSEASNCAATQEFQAFYGT
jgi:hypothetical protein